MEFYSYSSPPPRVVSKIVGNGRTQQTVATPASSAKREPLSSIGASTQNSGDFRSPVAKKVVSFGSESVFPTKSTVTTTPNVMNQTINDETVSAVTVSDRSSPEWVTTAAVDVDVKDAVKPSPPTTAKVPRPNDLFDKARHLKAPAPTSEVTVAPAETTVPNAVSTHTQQETTYASATFQPKKLKIVFQLPPPVALLDVNAMTLADAVRELGAVTTQREAETVAALEALQLMQRRTAETPKVADSSDEGIKGEFILDRYDVTPITSLRQQGLTVDFSLEESETVAFKPTADDSSAFTPSISVVIRYPAPFDANTKAYIVPRRNMQAGVLYEGPPQAVDASTAIKQFLLSSFEDHVGSCNTVEETLKMLSQSANAGEITTLRNWANSYCRVLPHAHLTPLQSEERVRSLVLLMRESLRYDITPPVAPLAATRLGSSHILTGVTSRSYSTNSIASSSSEHGECPSTPVRKNAQQSHQSQLNHFTPIMLHSGTKNRAAITFNYASGSALLSRSRFLSTPVPKALARYVSALDETRPNVSPASYHDGDHSNAVKMLQIGLNAMVAQRRQEEEHMRRVTRVKPSKNPRGGGYIYIHVDNGQLVPPQQYEHLYLAEVNYATEYINAATLVAWEQEVAQTVAGMETWSPAEAQHELDTRKQCASQRHSWWDQDIEEGVEDSASVAVSARGEASFLQLPLPHQQQQQQSSEVTEFTRVEQSKDEFHSRGATRTIAQLLCATLREWIVQERQRMTASLHAAPSPQQQADAAQVMHPDATQAIHLPFEVVGVLASAGTECLKHAADNALSLVRVGETHHNKEHAERKLWQGVMQAVCAYMEDCGARVDLPPAESMANALEKFYRLTLQAEKHVLEAAQSQKQLSTPAFSLSEQGMSTPHDSGVAVDAGNDAAVASVTDILNDAVQSFSEVSGITEAADSVAAIEGITLQMLTSSDAPVLSLDGTGRSLSPILSCAENDGEEEEDAAAAAGALDADDRLSDEAMTAAASMVDGMNASFGMFSSEPAEFGGAGMLVVPGVIPMPRENSSPTTADDDEHDQDFASAIEEGVFVPPPSPIHQHGLPVPSEMTAETVPIPARIGMFSPVKTNKTPLRATVFGDVSHPQAATPPMIPFSVPQQRSSAAQPQPRFSFIARARAALTSVFGSGSGDFGMSEDNRMRTTAVAATQKPLDAAEVLMDFFAAVDNNKHLTKTPRASPRPLPKEDREE